LEATAAKLAAPAVSCPLLGPFLRRALKLTAAPRVLLYGELCGANVTFLGEKGFGIRVEGSPVTPPIYEQGFTGALLWDFLSAMSSEAAARWVARIREGLLPGGAVLAFFPAAGAPAHAPRKRYRIHTEDQICAEILAGRTIPARPYQNRDIIRLFDGFNLENLHTHRDGQREALFFKLER
jgi:hypothetical protein